MGSDASVAYCEFQGWNMVRILSRRSWAKIPMTGPNEPDIPPRRSKKIRLGIYPTQIKLGEVNMISWPDQVSDLHRHGFWLAHCEFGYCKHIVLRILLWNITGVMLCRLTEVLCLYFSIRNLTRFWRSYDYRNVELASSCLFTCLSISLFVCFRLRNKLSREINFQNQFTLSLLNRKNAF